MDVWMCGLVFHELVTLNLLVPPAYRATADQDRAAWSHYARGAGSPMHGRPVECLREELNTEWKDERTQEWAVKPPLFKLDPCSCSTPGCQGCQGELHRCVITATPAIV